MLSEFENNLIAEMPVILDRKGRRWSLARYLISPSPSLVKYLILIQSFSDLVRQQELVKNLKQMAMMVIINQIQNGV